MQSPINIIAPVKEESGSTGNEFFIDYKFGKAIPVAINTNGVEMIVKLLGYGGAFKLIYKKDGTMVSYKPINISFRFPAEHTINGFRLDGEIVIVCDEITPKNNKVNNII